MKAHLRSVRIAPKKANLVAKMVRNMSVPKALASLERTNKKAARILEEVILSAAANARQNEKQNPDDLIIKSIVVNKAITYHRGIPMARGRMRRIRKFLSHITVELGHPELEKNSKTETKSSKSEARNLKSEIKPLAQPSVAAEEKESKEPKEAPAFTSNGATAGKKEKSKSQKKPETSSQSKKTPVKSNKTHSKKSEGSDIKSSNTTDASKSLRASASADKSNSSK